MPEYLAPGVYVEETSFRAKSIEGVSTTTTGFIGPARFGPIHLEPDILTSLGEFERIYGDGRQLRLQGSSEAVATEIHNYLWHAVNAFFNEGGRRLYCSRVFTRIDGASYDPDTLSTDQTGARNNDGHGRTTLGNVTLRARWPGSLGNMRVDLRLRAGQNILGSVIENDPATGASTTRAVIGALRPFDLVWIEDEVSPIAPDATGDLWIAEPDPSGGEQNPRRPGFWRFSAALGSPIASPLESLRFGDTGLPAADTGTGLAIRVVTLSVELFSPGGEPLGTWTDLPIDPRHRTGGAEDALGSVFGADADDRSLPLVIELAAADGEAPQNGLDIIDALFADRRDALTSASALMAGIAVSHSLVGGNDGVFPGAADYAGRDDPARIFKTGLRQFEDIEDISIVAAPGSTWNYANREQEADSIVLGLISHAERMRYRIAVLDSAEGQSIAAVRAQRARIDSTHAALYYPWVRLLDPITRREIALPPSGFVAGIYARNDVERAVYKAPANEVVRGAIGFDLILNHAQQEVLNPEGINCFRFFEGRGYRLWGARTVSSDPEWKYVNVRRYFAYLERSIDRGTQWAVFEPNGEQLWANVRRTIEDFLLNEWQGGALLGEKPERAFFVKCDRSTMSQNDLDNGRLVCLIGVAPLYPAEFVIFRIGQWTADRKV